MLFRSRIVDEHENFSRLDIMGINRLSSFDMEKQDARKNYNAAKAEYEREYCGFPFERLHVRSNRTTRQRMTCCFFLLSFDLRFKNFFERVDELRKRLAKDEDVQFQSDCSIIELRRLVREHPPKEVRFQWLINQYEKINFHSGQTWLGDVVQENRKAFIRKFFVDAGQHSYRSINVTN